MSITVGWNTAQAVGITREEMERGRPVAQRAIAAMGRGQVPRQNHSAEGASSTARGGTSASMSIRAATPGESWPGSKCWASGDRRVSIPQATAVEPMTPLRQWRSSTATTPKRNA